MNPKKKYYNYVHSTTRISIEHTFGMWKQRFRQLYYCKLKSFDLLLHFIRSCVVLHNLCIEYNDIYELESNEEDSVRTTSETSDSRSGIQLRDAICEELYNNRRHRR